VVDIPADGTDRLASRMESAITSQAKASTMGGSHGEVVDIRRTIRPDNRALLSVTAKNHNHNNDAYNTRKSRDSDSGLDYAISGIPLAAWDGLIARPRSLRMRRRPRVGNGYQYASNNQ